jgi:predicted MPP superfamily phosphohydrolase
MKKIYFLATASLLTIVLFFIVSHYFPKSVGRFPVFIVLFLLDLYLYMSLRQKIKSFPRMFSILGSFLYWMPAILTGLIIIGLLLYSFDHWGKGVKIYVVGFIFIGYFSKLLPISFLVIDDFRRVIQKLLKKNRIVSKNSSEAIPRSLFLKRLGLITGGVMFSGLLVGMVKWVSDFRIRRKIIRLSGLPASFSGFKIVQFSDIHLGGWASKKELEEAVQMMNDLEPDVIFFTGDLVNYKTDEAYEFTDILAKLVAKDGIYAILGNHDYGDYSHWPDELSKQENMTQLYNFYEQLGWKLLRNESDVLKKGNDELAILGVENWGSLSRFQKYGDLEKALMGIKQIPAKILLSHDPSHWELKTLSSPSTIGLTLAGHTHGAQFGFEFPGLRWSPSQYLYKYWAGLYTEPNKITGEKQYLYVNRGIGTIGYPGRVGIWPEITLIELQPQA